MPPCQANACLKPLWKMFAEDVRKAAISAPAIICIGKAVLLRQVLDWQAMATGASPQQS